MKRLVLTTAIALMLGGVAMAETAVSSEVALGSAAVAICFVSDDEGCVFVIEGVRNETGDGFETYTSEIDLATLFEHLLQTISN